MIDPYRLLVPAIALSALACAPPSRGPGVTAARGNEPFWAVSISGADAVVRTPDLPDGVPYEQGRWKAEDGSPERWVYRARRRKAEGRLLTLEVTKEPCTDSMSGDSFPFKARVSYDSLQTDGCAL